MWPERTFALVTHTSRVYAPRMDSVGSRAHESMRGSQDETPFPLEFEIVPRPKRVVHREGRSQDETAPFPPEFEVVARKAHQNQDQTSPFLLEFKVVLESGESAFVRTARPPRAPSPRRSSRRALPALKWHGVDASRELREYAARIAAGESLPPFRGPILANGESPRLRPSRHADAAARRAVPSSQRAASPAPRTGAPEADDDSKGIVKVALALMVMTALLFAVAVLGSDAQLRRVGQSISDWFGGTSGASLPARPIDPSPSSR